MFEDAARSAATDLAMMALGNERFGAEGATFIRNRSLPLIYDANHATAISASTAPEIERLLARAEREFAGTPQRCFYLDFDSPPQFEARLALEGYTRSDSLLMLLDGEPAGEPRAADIHPVADDSDWEALRALAELEWQEHAGRLGIEADLRIAAGHFQLMRNRVPPMRAWLAWVAGAPRAYLSSWEGVGSFGQVENLFTHRDFRHRGLATALLRHGIADCRAGGAGPVVIACDPNDTPKNMYAALGFRPVTLKRAYRRRVT